MSSSEKLCVHSLAVSKVPKICPKENIERIVKINNLKGEILDTEEVLGIEADNTLTRWIFLLESSEDLEKLIELREAELTYEGKSYTIVYQKAIPCEIPERWEKIKSPHRNPPVPKKRVASIGNPNLLQQQVGQYGMISGFYENVGQGGDPNMPGMPGQEQLAQGGQAFPQQPGYPYPSYGGPHTFDPNQQNVPGDHGHHNIPPGMQNDPPSQHYFPPQGQQGYPPGLPPGMMFKDPNTGMMVFQDPSTGQMFIVPGYPNLPDQTGTDGRSNMPPGPPPPYMQNLTETKVPAYLEHGPVVSASHAIDDQKIMEEKLASSAPIQEGEDQEFDEDNNGEEGSPNPDEEVEPEQSLAKLLVTNLPTSADEEYIEWFFSRKTFGRLEVQDVVYNEEDGCAIVEFGSPEDVDAVLEKVPIKFKGHEVEVERYEPEPEEPIDPCMVRVSGPEAVLSDLETLEFYFESTKRCGGGDIANIKYDEDLNVVVIQFEEEEAAQRVIEKKDHKVKKQTVTVEQFTPVRKKIFRREENVSEDEEFEDAKEAIPDTIKVSGVTDSIRSTVELYFENTKRSGGGDYEECWSDQEDKEVIYVKFNDTEVAHNVLERNHKVKGKKLTVEPYIPAKGTHSIPGKEEQTEGEQDEEIINDTVKVVGVYPAKRSTVELYFENNRRSGGGEYESIWSDEEEEGVIYIKYKSEEVAETVANRIHKVDKCELEVCLYTPAKETKSIPRKEKQTEGEQDEEIINDTVKVTGVDKSKRNTVELYFENTRRSGGGEYDSIWSDEEEEGVIYIKYKSEKVAKTVVSKSHRVENCELRVSLYTPPKPPPSYDEKILIKGMKETTSQDGLFNFIEAKSGFIPETMDYHESEPGIVMVTFESKPDFNKLEEVFLKYKLEGNTLKIAHVPISNCIMVSELPEQITQDTVHFYFENHRKSGGGDVDKVTMNDDDSCLVYFVDYTVIDNVLGRKHTLSKQTVIVQRYQDCLGRPEGDMKERKLKIPEPIMMKDIDKDKVKFLKKCDKNKRDLEQQLEACHSNVCWSREGDNIMVECTLSQSVDGCFRLAKTWKKDVLACVETYMGNIIVERIEILQDAWKNVIQKLQEVTIENPESLALFVDSKGSLITIVGTKEAVVKLKTKIDGLLKDVMDEMERERQKVKEVVTNLKLIETKMLLADKFHEKMEKKFKIQMKININKNEIVFEGPSGDVRDAKLNMYEAKSRFSYKKIDSIPKLSLQLYTLKQTKEYIVKQLKAKNIISVWDAEGSSLQVCSLEEHIDDSCHIVQRSVNHAFINLKKEQGSLVNSEKWQTKTIEFNKANQGKCLIEVTEEQRKVIVCSTDDIHADNVDTIRKFFRLNTLLMEKVTCTKEAHRLINKHHSSEVEKIARDLEEYNVQISSSSQYGTFELKGTEDGIKKAKAKLNTLLKRVQRRDHDINKPGLGDYIRTPKGKDNLNTVESSYPVVVSLKDDGEDSDDAGGYGDEEEGSSMDGVSIYASCKLYDCREIYCGKGDMTEMDVEALVNSANEKLSFAGGLGKVIIRKGGKQIENECKDYIKKATRLGDGEVFVSTAGNLKANYVVHVRGPAWNGGTNDEEDMLEEAVFKCLRMASAKGANSIAMPAISCGAFGYPVQRATSTIVDAVKNYFREDQDSNVTQVYLCDVKSETVEAFSAAMVTHLQSVQVMKKKESKSTGRPAPKKRFGKKYSDSDDDEMDTSGHGRRKPIGGKKVLPSSHSGPSKSKHFEDSVSFGNVKVTLVKAEISRDKVDMIVNTTAKNLDLKNGAVSASLLKAGGSGLQDELSKNYPNGIKDGEVAITSGHKLKCSHVVHTSLTNFDSKNPSISKKALQGLMKNCLKEAENQGVSSIAFPAIGTGNLGYPKDLVAKEMFQAVANFSFNSVTDVKIIVYQKDFPTIQAFNQELKRLQPGGGAASGGNDDDDSSYDSDEDLNEDLGYSGTSDNGQINITVKQGDITSERTDCIVNSTNEDLDLSRGAVSKSMLKKGGKKLEQALSQKKSDMKKHHLVITDAPNMNCKKIVHVVAVDELAEWRGVVSHCLAAAEKSQLKSIAFPALGTGIRMKASDIAPLMVGAVRDFEKSKPYYLTDVHFVIFQDAMVEDFRKAIGKQNQDGGRVSRPVKGPGRANKAEPKGRPRTSNANKVTFRISSLDASKIKDARRLLEACIEKEISEQTFADSIIMKFDDSQAKQVQQIADQHQLKVDLKRSEGNLIINGLTANVNAAVNEIHKLLRKVQSDEKDRQAADLMVSLVQWYFIEVTDTGQNLTPYDKELNYRIELAFRTKSTNNIAFVADGTKFLIDFNDMIEYPEGNKQDQMTVIRRDLVKQGSFEAPSNWSDFNGNQKVVVLQPTDNDYKTLEQTFLQSAGSGFTVEKIQRIMNKTLWAQYQAKKKQLDDQNPKGTQNERLLWHGTAPEAVDNINAHGFNRSYCGKNAAYYGDGVYFAVDASYSVRDTYSRPDAVGVKRMYYCHVLTGEYTLGKQKMRVAPPKTNTGDKTAIYDSVVENMNKPGMFIIFHDTQAYPEYLVSFKKK